MGENVKYNNQAYVNAEYLFAIFIEISAAKNMYIIHKLNTSSICTKKFSIHYCEIFHFSSHTSSQSIIHTHTIKFVHTVKV